MKTAIARAGLALLAMLAGCVADTGISIDSLDSGATNDGYAVLVMAHGGQAPWNDAVLDAVEPLRDRYTIEVAFGMADANTIQHAVSRLEEQGAQRIGVVRLFVSGESWYERTEQILGIAPGAPNPPVDDAATVAADEPASASSSSHSHGAGGHCGNEGFYRIHSSATFVMSRPGLSEEPAMGQILLERARALSDDARNEDVLILAHGPADDAENARWIENIDDLTEPIRSAMPFNEVRVMTLREDWPAKREAVEQRIRSFVTDAAAQGRTAIIIPFRVHGFGPYENVLDGLSYTADGAGLLPHPLITEWIERQASLLHRSADETQALRRAH